MMRIFGIGPIPRRFLSLLGCLPLAVGCAGLPQLGGTSAAEKPLATAQQPAAVSNDDADLLAARAQSLPAELARAHNLSKSGKPEKAREIYQRLIKQHPDRVEPFHKLGVLADHQRRHLEAQALLTEAVRLDPRNAEILNDLGYCFFLQGKLSKAESALRKATTLDPLTARYHNNLGMVLGQMHRDEEALQEFRRAGSEADAYYNLAFVLATQRELEAAKACFQQALNIDPTHEAAREALDNFRRYEEDPELAASTDLPDAGNYVPYIEGSDAGSVVPASATSTGSTPATSTAGIPTPRAAGAATRALRQQSEAALESGALAPTSP